MKTSVCNAAVATKLYTSANRIRNKIPFLTFHAMFSVKRPQVTSWRVDEIVLKLEELKGGLQSQESRGRTHWELLLYARNAQAACQLYMIQNQSVIL